MLRYKKVAISALLFSLFSIILAFIISTGEVLDYSLYVRLLKDYTYCFLFSCFLLLGLRQEIDESLIILSFDTFKNYRSYKVKTKLVEYAITLLIIAIVQTPFFLILDPHFSFFTFLYRNLIFYCLINYVNYIVTMVSLKARNKWTLIIAIIWIVLIFMINAFSDVVLIKQINPFLLLIRFDLSLIMQHLIMAGVIVVTIEYSTINKKRFLLKWLD